MVTAPEAADAVTIVEMPGRPECVMKNAGGYTYVHSAARPTLFVVLRNGRRIDSFLTRAAAEAAYGVRDVAVAAQ